MLDKYTRDSAYFQSLRDRNMSIARRDLDLSFNNIVDYINKQVLPVVSTLTNKKAVGVQGGSDRFLRNIGNGDTVFDIIRSSDLSDYSLGLNKFIQQIPYGVITSNSNDDLQTFAPTEDNQVLVAGENLVPVWKKLSAANFADRSVDSTKVAIGTLSARHLAQGIIGKPLNANSIETRYIKDNTITGNKIAPSSFDSTKISAALMATRAAGNQLEFTDKCFTARTIANNSVDIQYVFFKANPSQSGRKYPQFSGIFSPKNIPLNSIELKEISTKTNRQKINVRTQMDNSIIPSKVKAKTLSIPTIRAQLNGWPYLEARLKLSKNNLSPEVKAILVNKGGLKP